jgi:proline iminopeptidase
MRLVLLLALQLFTLSAFAQKIDSIKYSNGYLYFHEYGSGDPVIVLTGGPGAGYLQLEEVAINLGKHKRAILLEQRGTGRSKPVPYDTSTINLQTAHDDINRLMDYLQLKQAHLLGHSWGAMLAMSFATEYPARVKSLVLIDSGPFKFDRVLNETFAANKDARLTPEDRAARDAAFKNQNENATEENKKLARKWELVPVLYDRTRLDTLFEKITKAPSHPQMGSLMFRDLSKKKFDLSKKLPLFKNPVHIIAGAQDPGAFVSYELKILLPQANLHWINKSGHFPMYEQPEQFYSTLFKTVK